MSMEDCHKRIDEAEYRVDLKINEYRNIWVPIDVVKRMCDYMAAFSNNALKL